MVEYLKTQAELGITKHIGGVRATETLVRECGIRPGMRVLDVGCGVGLTACRIAKGQKCRVTGVDISPKMIEWAKKNAREEGVEGMTEFLVADAQGLPFGDGEFDAVICESVLAFVQDDGKALFEFARVLKKGGFVGLTEATWVKKPTPEMVEYFRKYSGSRIEEEKTWRGLLTSAGLEETYSQSGRVGMLQEALDRIALIGWKRILRAWWLLLTKYLWKPEYMALMKESSRYPAKVMKYMGYGIYVGRK
jgi:ubiquinone/menaquinone biosynthesis C-methylase UbiE